MTQTTAAPGRTYLPPADVEALGRMERILGEEDAVVSVSGGDAALVAPDDLKRLLLDVVSSLRRGRAITIAPHALRLTTQQSADLLGISRPTLVKLLEAGKIPYETPSRHRRVLLTDLLAYQELRRHERSSTLDDLAVEAQDMGLYDVSPENYEAALDEARRKRA